MDIISDYLSCLVVSIVYYLIHIYVILFKFDYIFEYFESNYYDIDLAKEIYFEAIYIKIIILSAILLLITNL